MSKLQIEYRTTASLTPYARNSRTHSEQQVAQIAASIAEFGFTNPILLAEDGTLIAGHGRLLAAQMLKLTDVPTITLVGLTEAQRRALVIADNRIAENAGWDLDMLRVELGDLQVAEFDMSLLGFSADELLNLLAPQGIEGNTDPDETPPVPENPVAVLGDVWVLGRHRLVCGDSTSADDVSKALGSVKPYLMVTDPPYGVDYDPEWRSKAAERYSSMNRDPKKSGAVGKVANDQRSDWREAWALFPGDVVYAWHGEKQLVEVAEQLRAADFELRNLIVWGKGSLVMGRGNYHSQHETCWYAVRKGATGHWAGDRKQTTLWSIEKPSKNDTGHATQKPVECMKRPIENNSSPGQAVYEPFSGSGTTIIACEMTGRACHALEIEPAYVDVAILRWQAFTGLHAHLESDGRSFTEVMGERAPGKLVGSEAGKADKKESKKPRKAAASA